VTDVDPVQATARKHLEASPFKNDHHRSQEQRVRRAAARQGHRLSKSARRDRRALDFGRWYLKDSAGAVLMESKSLSEIEAFLKGDDQ
jgi:hypothetical protein